MFNFLKPKKMYDLRDMASRILALRFVTKSIHDLKKSTDVEHRTMSEYVSCMENIWNLLSYDKPLKADNAIVPDSEELLFRLYEVHANAVILFMEKKMEEHTLEFELFLECNHPGIVERRKP
jgi:hypothetical protein